MCSSDIFLGLIAVLFPPLAVWVKRGICSADSLINLCLCTLGFIPGLLHAWYIIAKYPEPDATYETIPQDIEGSGARITYVIVQTPNGGTRRVQMGAQGAQGGYGTNKPMEAPSVRQEGDGRWGVGEGSSRATNQVEGAGVGSSAAAAAGQTEGQGQAPPPPTYADAVKGDHKVQTKD